MRPWPYTKGDKKDTANYRLISLLNLDYKFILLILKNQMRKTLVTIIAEHQSEASKFNTFFVHTLSTIYVIIYESNKLNIKIFL